MIKVLLESMRILRLTTLGFPKTAGSLTVFNGSRCKYLDSIRFFFISNIINHFFCQSVFVMYGCPSTHVFNLAIVTISAVLIFPVKFPNPKLLQTYKGLKSGDSGCYPRENYGLFVCFSVMFLNFITSSKSAQ